MDHAFITNHGIHVALLIFVFLTFDFHQVSSYITLLSFFSFFFSFYEFRCIYPINCHVWMRNTLAIHNDSNVKSQLNFSNYDTLFLADSE